MRLRKSALDKDPVGLLISPANAEDTRRIGSLDAYPPIVTQAIAIGVQLVVCHHPLIYAPLRRLDCEDTVSEPVMALVRAGAGLYAMHTNWDRAPGGVNETLASLMGLTDVTTFADTGTAAIARIGTLLQPMGHDALAEQISDMLDCRGTSTLRSMRSRSGRAISRVAVCGGAGGSLVADAVAAGADALITADVRHHEYVEAFGRDIALFDAGHSATEEPGMRSLANLLSGHFQGLRLEFLAF